MRRLIDMPGIADLEAKALMKPRMADLGSETDFPEIDEACMAAFGLTVAQADETPRPDGWDNIENKPLSVQADQAEAEGLDVTDKRRTLRMLGVIAAPMWLALRGVAGALPFQADTADEDVDAAMLAGLAKDAKAFRKNRV